MLRESKVRLGLIGALVAVLIAAGVVTAVALLRDDGGGAPVTLESLGTRTVCQTGGIEFTIDRSRFVAFLGGYRPPGGGKLLLLEMTATNAGNDATSVDPGDLALYGDGGTRFEQVQPDSSYGAVAGPVRSRQSTPIRAAFAVPLKVSVGRLVFDDGCGHEEWIVP